MWESIARNGVVHSIAISHDTLYKRCPDSYMNKARYGGGDQITYVLRLMETWENKNGD